MPSDVWCTSGLLPLRPSLLYLYLTYTRITVLTMSDAVLLTPPLSESELTLADEVQLKTKPGRDAACTALFERKMGDTELSYYLPSRESGVNDM